MKKILILFLLLFPLPTADADVLVSVVNHTAEVGKSFNIIVNVEPSGLSVAGLQLDLLFNPLKIKINNISEGNFLKQGGASTFFNNGTTDSNGTIRNIYSAIIGASNVSTSGTFLIISGTALSVEDSGIILDNLKVASPESTFQSAIQQNGIVRISAATSGVGGGSIIYNKQNKPKELWEYASKAQVGFDTGTPKKPAITQAKDMVLSWKYYIAGIVVLIVLLAIITRNPMKRIRRPPMRWN